MKQRLAVCLLAAILLMCLPAFAADVEEAPLLGGTKEWPQIRGIDFGQQLSWVLLKEESRGIIMTYDDLDGQYPWPAYSTMQEPPEQDVTQITMPRFFDTDAIPLFGYPGILRYEFQNGVFVKATGIVFAADPSEASAIFQTILPQIEALYGEADKKLNERDLCWLVGWGLNQIGSLQDESGDGYTGTLELSVDQDQKNKEWLVILSVGTRYYYSGAEANRYAIP